MSRSLNETGLLAACFIVTTALLWASNAPSVDCFSTPSTRGHKALASSMRNGAPLSSENLYTQNYITAIEDRQTRTNDSSSSAIGFMVSTTDHNYAIYSPSLLQRGWLTHFLNGEKSVTVNGDQVFIVTKQNLTISTSLFGLDEQQRDFISELRSNFTQNLAGLKFAHYTSGSSTQLNQLAPLKGGLSVASMAINQLDLVSRYGGGDQAAYAPTITDAPTLSLIPPGASTSAYHQIDSNTANPTHQNLKDSSGNLIESNSLPPSASSFFSRALAATSAAISTATSALIGSANNATTLNATTTKTKRSQVPFAGGRQVIAGDGFRNKRRPLKARDGRVEKWRARSDYNPAMAIYSAELRASTPSSVADLTKVIESEVPDYSRSLCATNRVSDNFNYYNLAQARLNVTLTGDVYYFDLHCNILDVYSSSVSIRQQDNLSALYRDANFFSYARSGLPLAINRFFLSHEHAFFVYNDGSVLVKLNWMLDQIELEIVVEARQRLKLVSHWQGKAADLLAKSQLKNRS